MTDSELFALLFSVMCETRTNKRYGKDSMAFEEDWPSLLVRMMDELRARTFRIRYNYAFLVSQPKWREIFATEFAGRMADHLLCDTLRPYIDKVLHNRTFNNRIGLGLDAAIKQVVEDISELRQLGENPWVIKWDLKGFFPNANRDIMQTFFDRIITDNAEDIAARFGYDKMPDFLHWLVMICIHCDPAAHCELRTPPYLWVENIPPEKSLFSKPAGIGVPIGRLTSQIGMGLYINDEVAWLNDECLVRTTVFMDDGVMVVPERMKGYALSLLPQLRVRLEAKGVRMNDKKFYCQPAYHGLEFLGSHIHANRVILNDATYGRAIERIKEFNSYSAQKKFATLDNFLSSFNSYTGLLKNRTSHHRIEYLFSIIHPDYLQWVDIDHRRQCLVCKPAFSSNARIAEKYHLHLRKMSA